MLGAIVALLDMSIASFLAEGNLILARALAPRAMLMAGSQPASTQKRKRCAVHEAKGTMRIY